MYPVIVNSVRATLSIRATLSVRATSRDGATPRVRATPGVRATPLDLIYDLILNSSLDLIYDCKALKKSLRPGQTGKHCHMTFVFYKCFTKCFLLWPPCHMTKSMTNLSHECLTAFKGAVK